jgi:hypothetical protein
MNLTALSNNPYRREPYQFVMFTHADAQYIIDTGREATRTHTG